MSVINEKTGSYKLALQQLNKYYFNQKDKIFLCGTASRIYINGYTKRSTSLLKHLGDYKKINSESIKMLLYIKDETFLNTLLNSLLKEYSLKEIKNELITGIKNINKGKIKILSGRKIEMNYMLFFDKKIIIWKNHNSQVELLEYLNNNIGYQYILRAKQK